MLRAAPGFDARDAPMMELAGNVALVTGGLRGIGAAIALELAQNGADVAICDLRLTEEGDQSLDTIRRLGRKVLFCAADGHKNKILCDLP